MRRIFAAAAAAAWVDKGLIHLNYSFDTIIFFLVPVEVHLCYNIITFFFLNRGFSSHRVTGDSLSVSVPSALWSKSINGCRANHFRVEKIAVDNQVDVMTFACE